MNNPREDGSRRGRHWTQIGELDVVEKTFGNAKVKKQIMFRFHVILEKKSNIFCDVFHVKAHKRRYIVSTLHNDGAWSFCSGSRL